MTEGKQSHTITSKKRHFLPPGIWHALHGLNLEETISYSPKGSPSTQTELHTLLLPRLENVLSLSHDKIRISACHICVVMLLDSRFGKSHLKNDHKVQCQVLQNTTLVNYLGGGALLPPEST